MLRLFGSARGRFIDSFLDLGVHRQSEVVEEILPTLQPLAKNFEFISQGYELEDVEGFVVYVRRRSFLVEFDMQCKYSAEISVKD